MTEKVSIIMPSYNTSSYISEAIESVITQTYCNWELIICDDMSTDNSRELAEDYQKSDNRIIVIDNNYYKGASGARNSCLDAASGRYIAFLDADDRWYASKLEIQIEYMLKHHFAFTYTYHNVIDEEGKFQFSLRAPANVTLRKIKYSNFIPCLTVIYDTNVLGKVYQPDIKKRNDYALWLRIFKLNVVKKAFCLDVVTAEYRSNTYGLSSKRSDLVQYYRRCLLEYGGYSQLQSLLCVPIYLIIMLFKKKFRGIYNKCVLFI